MAAYLATFAVACQRCAVPADKDAITVGFAAEAAEGDRTVLDTHEPAEGVFLCPSSSGRCGVPITALPPLSPFQILGVMKFFRAESLSFSVGREKAGSHRLLALR